MKTSLIRALLQSLLVVLALVLTPSNLFGQEPGPAAVTSAPAESLLEGPTKLEGTVETASVELLPASTPSSTSAFGSGAGDTAVFSALPMRPAAPVSMAPMAFVTTTAQPKMPAPHAFWDPQNRILFTTVAALATADFFATHANLANGGKELNPATRILAGSTPGLAANFAIETGAVIGLSYMFHKTGHHKLERVTALVDIGASGAAAGFSFAHR